MSILQHVQVGSDDSQSQSATTNFAGIFAFSAHLMSCGNCTCLSSVLTSETWILDSGASDHMTFNKSLLTNITTLFVPYLITLPNGYKVKVT